MSRTDCHRPSVIRPEDYEFVGVEYMRTDDIGEVFALAEHREAIRAHMEMTGGTYSRHQHGGNCHVCGAHCVYTALFWHEPSRSYIRTGFDCADKLDYHDEQGFRAIKEGVKNAREALAGRRKAQAILADAGLTRAWELAELDEDPTTEPVRACWHCGGHWQGCDRCEHTGCQPNSYGALCDIVSKLVRYGDISDKALAYLGKLIDRVDNYEQRKAEREAEQAAEREAAEPVPTGRVAVAGEVLTTRVQEGQYGTQYKMLVKDDRGFKVWGSIPSALQLFDVTVGSNGDRRTEQRGLQRGDRVAFTAQVEPSKDDPKFGFYKRPTRAKVDV